MNKPPKKEPRRVVAIAGRPNVGKSAIFNRISGKRIAIVHEESGVTRDRLIHQVVWSDQRFDLIDTGGIASLDGSETADVIQRGIHQQIEAALEDAAVVIMVVDIVKGPIPLDEEAARLLRRRGLHVLVAANKADNPDMDESAGDFARLGFPCYPVSALHNRGFDPLMAEVIKMLPPVSADETSTALKVAVVGRPNVGKSSYINALLGAERVIVSTTPGTTRDSIDIPFQAGSGKSARNYLLIDTAGLRRRGKIDTAVEGAGSIRAEQSVERADIVVLILDTMQGPTAFDKKIAELILQNRKGCVIVVNKWDLARGMPEKEYFSALAEELAFMRHCPVVFVSSKTHFNIRKSLDVIDHVALQTRLRLPTGVLNRAIEDAYERVNPPTIKGRRLRIFYSTQTGIAPVRIRLFVNNPALVVPAYKEHLVHSLRRKFGLEGATIDLQFKSRPRPKA